MNAIELLNDAVPFSPAENDGSFSTRPRRSLRRLLLPLFQRVAQGSHVWRAESVGYWRTPEGRYWMPRLVFQRVSEEPSIKLGIFAGIHGDEPAGVQALIELVRVLDSLPTIGRQYAIHLYPLCNPTGYEDGTRESRAGKDLNREFWRNSSEPEVQLLERELEREQYHGLVALHSDDTSDGLYGFVGGATLTEHLLKPALTAAAVALPVNEAAEIDGFHAINGIIRSAYGGILTAPPGARPAPFEIVLESPGAAPLHLQSAALLLATTEIIRHYRRMAAYGADL